MYKPIYSVCLGISVLFILSCIPVGTLGQKVFASNDAQNILYLGINNPISVAVDGIQCSSLQVYCDGIKIELQSCKAIVTPTRKGVFMIEIFQKGKKLGEFPFRVLELPLPVVRIGFFTSGDIPLKNLINYGGIMASVPTNQMDLEAEIVRFSILILKSNGTIIKLSNVGPKFEKEVIQEFTRLDIGDRVLFSSIEGLLGTKKLSLEAREFTIVK